MILKLGIHSKYWETQNKKHLHSNIVLQALKLGCNLKVEAWNFAAGAGKNNIEQRDLPRLAFCQQK